jgi:hypothetical protein
MYIPLTFEGALQKCLFASGGYEGYFLSGSQEWKYHLFTGSSTLQVQKGSIDNVEIYVIGGGGGGGNGNTARGAGGGGGGGVNYTTTGRLFSGTYNVVVGRGGADQTTTNSNGFNGTTSSFIGSNLSMIAGGGSGGGGISPWAGGTGGSPNGGNGGNGGTNSAGDGSLGITISIAEDSWGYGCGGGGAEDVFSGAPSGHSCNGTNYGQGGSQSGDSADGAPYYGMGGGGGNGSRIGRRGGSGSVIIKYPIYDYCTNYFNETGSCGCRQIEFGDPAFGGFYPEVTGSYLYMPCGGNEFISGTIRSYFDRTLCAVSNSYYSFSYRDPVSAILYVNAGLATSGPQCVSASLTPTTCSVEYFQPTCTSSIVTIYTPTASVGSPATFAYVAKNETTNSVYTSTTVGVKYICISTGSLFNGNQRYPQILSGNNAALYNTVGCNTITITSSPGRGVITLCNGQNVTLISPPLGSQYCIDSTLGIRTVSGFGLFGWSSGGSCLSGSFNTASCGCP